MESLIPTEIELKHKVEFDTKSTATAVIFVFIAALLFVMAKKAIS